MTADVTSAGDRIDAAFAENRLLNIFEDDVRALIAPAISVVDLELNDIIHDMGDAVRCAYFPFGTSMISLVIDLDGGRSIEVASIGHEGAVGGIVSCGTAPAFAKAQVIVPGQALRIEMTAIEEAKVKSMQLRDLFCRYADYLLSQVMQSVACNTFHSIEQRAARWLLTAQDRAGDRIALTQEALAGLLGVQRTTVNAVARVLQSEGLIVSRRGAIQVADRGALRARACECYAAVDRHFCDVVGALSKPGATCT